MYITISQFISVVLFFPQRGPNKVPVYALLVTTCITLIFIFIGEVNTLGPIVTMPFMLTYATVDYAYFALAMSYDKKKKREARFQESHTKGKCEILTLKGLTLNPFTSNLYNSRFFAFYYPIKSLLLEMECVFKHQNLLMYFLKLYKYPV